MDYLIKSDDGRSWGIFSSFSGSLPFDRLWGSFVAVMDDGGMEMESFENEDELEELNERNGGCSTSFQVLATLMVVSC